ncbi:hypothetical protein C9J19_20435 [Photobacterium phosphoreum]|uniref:hypothetical protein n=1 Tax=Photobacterium phosphoreum TaxID=659 RepID=UPI000D1564FB|nr:hypothetical protein [Photobacterium phosphoreum]PSW23965.1 hypothetical protein C9J19_20435 [Photobacterium phosphoreum]
MSCNHSDLESVMERVESYQGGGQRHICAGCAYLLGQRHRANGTKFDPSKVDDLPESQAQPQRHRNAYDAYKIGFDGI